MNLPDRSQAAPIRTYQVPQTVETAVSFAEAPGAYVRYAYARSSDSMSSQVEGQDYLCFRHNDQRLAFVVADGVGSSFCGNLAARILGDELLDWLWAADVAYMGSAAALSEAAASYLNRIQKTAQLEVEEYELPDMGSPLITQALEAQRAYGSEAIFAACRIEHPSPTVPDGLIAVLWMGDTQIRVLGEDGSVRELGGSFDNANRWSTRQGVRGALSAWLQPLAGVGRVLAFTDGLAAHANSLITLPDTTLDREIRQGALLSTSDDVALIDVTLRTPIYDGYPDPDLPDPNLERPHLEPIWNPAGEGTYELRWRWPGSTRGRISYMVQEATSPALHDARTFTVPQGETSWRTPEAKPPGHYYYRVRAMRQTGGLAPRSELTPWSGLQQVKVAHPPPPAPTLSADESGSTPQLAWEGEGEALDFVLQRAADADFSEPETVYEGRGTGWSVPGGQPGTYHFRVRAISDGGPGPWSAPQAVTVTVPPPSVPALGAVAYGYAHGEYELRWQPVPRATYYELEEAPAADLDAAERIRVEDTVYAVEGHGVGQWRYRVRACHAHGCSEWSAAQEAVVTPHPPADAPVLSLEGPDEDGVVTLRWDAVDTADEYLIEQADAASFENARMYTAAATEQAVTRREPGTLFFRVCAVNAGGEGPWSNVEQALVTPPRPEWIEAKRAGAGGTVTVSWAAAGGSATYRVEQAAGAGDFAPLYEGPETQVEASAPPGAAAVRYRVRAELAGIESGWQMSEPLPLRDGPPAPHAEPPEVDVDGLILFRWSKVDGAAAYRVEVSPEPDFARATSTRVTQPGISYRPARSGSYYFRVRALAEADGDEEIAGPPAEPQTVLARHPGAPRLHPLDPVKPGAPFTVAWSGVPDAAYYELQEAGAAGFEAGDARTVRVDHPAQAAAIGEGRQAGKRVFRVRAVNTQAETSPWSRPLVVEVQP